MSQSHPVVPLARRAAGWIRGTSFVLPLLAALVLPARGQQLDESTWVVDGVVISLAHEGHTVYAAGQFSYVAPRTGSCVSLDRATGVPDLTWPHIVGDVYEVVADGAGGWFIAGMFTSIAGQPRSGLAHLRPDGSLDGWNPSPDGFVTCMRLHGSTLIVSGYFAFIGGQARQGLAAIDVGTGQATAWNPGVGPSVTTPIRTFALAGPTLYAAGYFTSVGGQPRAGLAAIDVNTGTVLPWNPGATGDVNSIVVDGSSVYIGGWFSAIAGTSRHYAAALDASSGALLPWDPAPNTGLDRIAVSGNVVYVGGPFTQIGGKAHNCLSATDPVTGAVSDWNPDVQGNIGDIRIVGGTLYVSGGFPLAGGQNRRGLAAFDLASGLVTAWNPHPNGDVFAFDIAGGRLVAGGRFSGAGGVTRRNLAAFDDVTGVPTSWDPSPNDVVWSVAPAGSRIYVAGPFTQIRGQTYPLLAAIDAGSGLPYAWSPTLDQSPGVLRRVGTSIVISGGFQNVNGQPRNGLAAFDAATGALRSWSPSIDGYVTTLGGDDGTVYLGGAFTMLGGQPRTRVGAVDLATGNVTAFDPAPDSYARAIVPAPDGRVFVAGYFTSIGGAARQGIAALDGTTGVATAWDAHASAGIDAATLVGSTLYLSGNFSSLGGLPRKWVAAVDANTALATPWAPIAPVVGSAIDLCAGGNRLYVAGQGFRFTDYGPEEGLLAYPLEPDAVAPLVHVVAPDGGEEWFVGQHATITWTASDANGIAGVNLSLSRTGPTGPWESLATGVPNSGSFDWLVTGPTAIASAYVRVEALDPAGNPGVDTSDQGFSISSVPVPTRIVLFRASPSPEGVLVEWELANPAEFRSLRLERAPLAEGPWNAVSAPERQERARHTVLDAAAPVDAPSWYRLAGEERGGASYASAPIPVSGNTPITAVALAPLAPNPFTGRTAIAFELPVRAPVRLALVDVQGRVAAVLVDGVRESGRYTAVIDATDLRAGVYYVRLETPGARVARRAVVLH